MTVKLQDTLQKRGINAVLLTDLSKAIDCLSINFLTMKLHVCCYFTILKPGVQYGQIVYSSKPIKLNLFCRLAISIYIVPFRVQYDNVLRASHILPAYFLNL